MPPALRQSRWAACEEALSSADEGAGGPALRKEGHGAGDVPQMRSAHCEGRGVRRCCAIRAQWILHLAPLACTVFSTFMREFNKSHLKKASARCPSKVSKDYLKYITRHNIVLTYLLTYLLTVSTTEAHTGSRAACVLCAHFAQRMAAGDQRSCQFHASSVIT